MNQNVDGMILRGEITVSGNIGPSDLSVVAQCDSVSTVYVIENEICCLDCMYYV